MDNEKLSLLKDQVVKVIKMLEIEYKDNPTNMLELLLRRYRSALNVIHTSSDIKKKDIYIQGGARAYLESATDYLNPILEEMHNAEKLLENMLNQK